MYCVFDKNKTKQKIKTTTDWFYCSLYLTVDNLVPVFVVAAAAEIGS